MKTKYTPIPFLWSIIKPYKYCYLIMMIAPLASGVYPIIYNYAVKLLLDLFTQNEQITFAQSYKPVMGFLTSQAILDGSWRAHNFAQLKAMPYIKV
jgi:ABC-type multidrug transport system fused ATPase/permease subunit